ncbi:MAG: type III-B CRISPR module-associated protein Cmr5 [Desulfotomaculaceae bacterium]|nr:type III-B CRISPR module-associated protein Cmr5 [Desulfotomaculaceae bacterium]
MTGKVSTITGLEQGRAQYAYGCAEDGQKIEKRKEYKAYVKNIPMLIKTNGLGAAFAFIDSKKKDDQTKPGYAYKMIYEQVDRWLQSENKKYLLATADPSKRDLAARIVSLSSPDYRAVTNEVMALFMWLRRFAEALIEGGAEDGR